MQCPRCKRELAQDGEVVTPEFRKPLPVFACEHCTEILEIGTERIESALMFTVTPDGKLLDSTTFEPLA